MLLRRKGECRRVEQTKTEKISKRKFIDLMCERVQDPESPYQKVTKEQIKEFYELFMQTLMGELIKGNDVTLFGLGVFKLKIHKGHKAFVPEFDDEDYVHLCFEPAKHFSQNMRRKHGKRLIGIIRARDNTRSSKTTIDNHTDNM